MSKHSNKYPIFNYTILISKLFASPIKDRSNNTSRAEGIHRWLNMNADSKNKKTNVLPKTTQTGSILASRGNAATISSRLTIVGWKNELADRNLQSSASIPMHVVIKMLRRNIGHSHI